MMKTKHDILLIPLLVLMALLMTACSSDSDVATDDTKPLPEGMGRIRITICTPEANPNLTRAVNVNPWEAPDHDWEKLQSYRILICNATLTEGKYTIKKIVSGTTMGEVSMSTTESKYRQSAEITTEIEQGTYYIFATANFNDGYIENGEFDLNATTRFPNGYATTGTTYFGNSNPIPMTGKLDEAFTVSSGQTTDAGTIVVWRVIGKMQFEFTNEASEDIEIMGVEVDPINTNASDQGLIYLFSKDDLTSTANLPASGTGTVSLPSSGVTTGPVTYETSTTTPLLTLEAKNDGDTDEGTLFFYVNETNATFTTTQNQYSLRFKIKRGGTISELRYGVTTHYGNGSTGQDGFNVIRRNDWIHIPIILTDWHYRIEPLAFVPIAGYPATTVSSDGLNATFGTGGMIALQPFIMKYTDSTWRDFGDSEVTFVSITWKNSNGTDDYGDSKIIKTAFVYDDVTKCIIGELNQTQVGHNYKTTFTVNVDLGKAPDPVYHYSFTFNVILQ